jgi:hypothetical protein
MLCPSAAVDFSLLSDEDDVLWQAEHRETRREIQARGRLFMEQVMARPEMHIAVSTQHTWPLFTAACDAVAEGHMQHGAAWELVPVVAGCITVRFVIGLWVGGYALDELFFLLLGSGKLLLASACCADWAHVLALGLQLLQA